MVLYPEKLGAFDATNKELEGLVHLWAVLGHLLGIKDEYNICLGGLELCKQKCRAFADSVVSTKIFFSSIIFKGIVIIRTCWLLKLYETKFNNIFL